MQQKALLIVNPYSGKKNGAKAAAEIRARLQQKNIGAEIFTSRSLEDLDAFIRNIRFSDYSWVGIIGGDGTMHEFINTALRHHPVLEIPVALFPCGTGNAFNFDIGCATIENTLDCIFSQSISTIDVAEVKYSGQTLWSFNILGCGLVAEINRLAEKMRFLGSSRYNVASVIKLLANPKFDLKISTGDKTYSGKYSFLLACNTRYTGKGMMMAPEARLSDGKFDVLLVTACSRWKLFSLFPKIFKGKHIGADIITYIQTDELEAINVSKKMPTNIDGEIKGELPFSFRVHNNKVRMFVRT